MVLNYQSSSSGIQLGHAMVGKSQIFQHFIHLEVNLTFSTAWAVRKAVLWASDIMISTISLQEYYQKFVKIELKLLPLSGEKRHRRATNQLNEERLDIRVRGFWNSSQQAFFDIRVFDPNACRYLNKSRQQCHAMNKHEKRDCATNRCYKSTTEHSHLSCFQFTVAWEENAICFIHGYLTRGIYRNR